MLGHVNDAAVKSEGDGIDEEADDKFVPVPWGEDTQACIRSTVRGVQRYVMAT